MKSVASPSPPSLERFRSIANSDCGSKVELCLHQKLRISTFVSRMKCGIQLEQSDIGQVQLLEG